jgi:hypothetical protein
MAVVNSGTISAIANASEKAGNPAPLAQATGVEQIIKLIANVVERQDQRSHTRRARA